MKRLIPILALAAFPLAPAKVHAQYIVHDPGSAAQSAIQHATDLAKYVEMITKQVEQINLLTSQLQQVTAYVEAFGDPSSLLNITGADRLVSQLRQQPIGQLLGDLQQAASGAQSLRHNANGLYRSIESISISGVEVPRAESLYRKFGALENTVDNFQTVHEQAQERIQSLKRDISSTTTSLQAATTDAQVQKLQGVLAGQQAELAALQAEVQQAAAEVTVQDALNRNDEEKQAQAQREKDAAEWGITTRQLDGIMTIPTRR